MRSDDVNGVADAIGIRRVDDDECTARIALIFSDALGNGADDTADQENPP